MLRNMECCAADPGSMTATWVPDAVHRQETLHRVGDTDSTQPYVLHGVDIARSERNFSGK